MQRLRATLSVLFLLALGASLRASPATAPVPPLLTGHVAKVLPLFMDLKGQVAPSPSLFDRDAYQVYLQDHPTNITGIRFDVAWSVQNSHDQTFKLRLEVRGTDAQGLPTQKVFEQMVTPRAFHHWTSLTLAGLDYKNFGVLAAWHATLWNGSQLLNEQQSFLWSVP